MPVILPRSVEQQWLDREVEPGEALALLQPYPAEQIRSAEASMLVNAVANDDLRLFDPSE
jgi:putative SOS response-associated peptidase YedK